MSEYGSRERGSRISVSDYPNQGLDVPSDGYKTRNSRRTLLGKYPRAATPLGTPLADLVRLDQSGALSSQGGWDQAADAWHPGDAKGDDY